MSALPHNIEAEQQLLGAILNNNDIYDRIAAIIGPQHFHEPVHARIFEIAAARIAKNALASPVTLKGFLEDDEGLKELGGAAYLAKLVGRGDVVLCGARLCPDDLRPAYPPRADRARPRHRRPRPARQEAASEPKDQIVEAESALYKLADQGKSDSGFQSFLTAVTEAVKVANAAYQRDGGLAGMSTGVRRHRPQARRAAPVGPADPRRAAVDGQDLAGHQHRLQHRQGLQARAPARWQRRRGERRRGRVLLAGDVVRTAGRPGAVAKPPKCRPNRSAAATWTRPSSAASSRPPRRWKAARSTSTTPRRCRSASSPPAPGG